MVVSIEIIGCFLDAHQCVSGTCVVIAVDSLCRLFYQPQENSWKKVMEVLQYVWVTLILQSACTCLAYHAMLLSFPHHQLNSAHIS